MPRAASTGDAKHRERVRRYRKRLHADSLPEADQVYSALAASVASATRELVAPVSGKDLMGSIFDGAIAVLRAQGYDAKASKKILFRIMAKKRFQDVLAYGKHHVDSDPAV